MTAGLHRVKGTLSLQRSGGVGASARQSEADANVYTAHMFDKVGEWYETENLTIAELADGTAAELEKIRLGHRLTSDRFAEYVEVLRECSMLRDAVFPPSFDAHRRALFYEAMTQASLFRGVAAIWPALPPNVAKHKLRRLLAGAALPRPGVQVDQDARNILAEFAGAWLAKRRLPDARLEMFEDPVNEDFRLTLPDTLQLMVESKRCEAVKSMHQGLRDGHGKLRALMERTPPAGPRVGMVMICIDRILDPFFPAFKERLRDVPSFGDEGAMHHWVDRTFVRAVLASLFAGEKAQRTLFPHVPFVGLLLAVPVLVADADAGGEVVPRVALMLSVHNTPTGDPKVRAWELYPQLKAAFFDEGA